MIKFFTVLSFACFFISCASDKQKTGTVPVSDSLDKTKASVPAASKEIGYYKIDGDSLIIPFFEINVNLTEKAQEKLSHDKETIIVDAVFTGQPADTTSAEYLENGEIFVASSKKEIVYGQTARFENIKFPRALYDSLADKDIQLLINVYSGRRSSEFNLLECGIIQDKMSTIKNKKFVLQGKLIGED